MDFFPLQYQSSTQSWFDLIHDTDFTIRFPECFEQNLNEEKLTEKTAFFIYLFLNHEQCILVCIKLNKKFIKQRFDIEIKM